MSYILEALKKSDQKRQKGQIPDLSTVQIEIPQENKKKALWPYILMGILFLNAVVLAVIILPDKAIEEPQDVVQNAGKQKLIAVEEKQIDIEPLPTHTLSPVTPERSPMPVVPTVDKNMVTSQEKEERNPEPIREVLAEATIIVDEPNIEEVDSEFVSGMNMDTSPEETHVSIQEPATDSTVEEMDVELNKELNRDTNQNEPQVEPIQEMVTDSTIEEVVKESVLEPEHIIDPQEDFVRVAKPESLETTILSDEQLEVTEADSIPQRQHTVPETPTPDKEKIRAQREPLHIMQLPSSIQEQLPEFHISAHVYFAKRPASRLASINGKILREGKKLIPGLKVEEITSDGVIFSYREYIFHVPIL